MKKYTLLAMSLLAVLTLSTGCSTKTPKTNASSSASSSQVSTSSSSSTDSSSSVAAASSSEAPAAEPVTDPADAIQNDNTGVTLDSGQDTINYANSILGDKGWTVLEDNYNRTDSIPYNLLQGTDGSLYRVYQNGVILDMDDTVVHQP
ncbi:hypothetical protein BU202_02115 [Streptococcus cuniculi]|uniref:Lipoprotein n=1 Tax=Streptococcus cuniculi TaxID=1432788 RepID=A0A1Q8E9F9_9STRE|nr:hypothetical protein [Streptococcus cuniculi]OLF48433.1 hypothetical protein BU202_02115 [Streptococcus cuniculi]